MAAFAIKGELTGLDDVLGALDRLQKRGTRNKIKRKALQAAGKLVLDAAKANVPQETGLLRKSLGRKQWTKEDTVVVIVGPRTGFKREVAVRGKSQWRNPVKYAHLVEGGTAPHDITPTTGPFAGRTLHHPGTTGTHFLQQAFDSMESKATATVTSIIWLGIEAEWAKRQGAAA